MLSVIIPTEGVEQPAVATLAALVPGAAAGIIREVLLVDRSDTGVIERVADVAGCRFLRFEGTRSAALAEGARQARSPWLMFLRAGAVLDPGWIEETTLFIQGVALSGRPRAGIFRYARSPYAEARLRDRFRFLARIAGAFESLEIGAQPRGVGPAHFGRLPGNVTRERDHRATRRRRVPGGGLLRDLRIRLRPAELDTQAVVLFAQRVDLEFQLLGLRDQGSQAGLR